MILLGLDKYDEALESFDRASELVPEAPLPYQHRGELYRQKGDLEKALEQLTKALELPPDSVATLLVRAGVYYELKQTDKALEDIEQGDRAAAHAGPAAPDAGRDSGGDQSPRSGDRAAREAAARSRRAMSNCSTGWARST